jgi:hypothetical protein
LWRRVVWVGGGGPWVGVRLRRVWRVGLFKVTEWLLSRFLVTVSGSRFWIEFSGSWFWIEFAGSWFWLEFSGYRF